MRAVIQPGKLQGEIDAIVSKSSAHRMLICAAMAEGETEMNMPQTSLDIEATVSCLRAVGAVIERENGRIKVTPAKDISDKPILDCGESGSTLRFMLPVASVLCRKAAFTGHGRLPERPLSDLTRAMKDHGVGFSSDNLPLEISGKMRGGEYNIPGNVSSQYITGLLLALAKEGTGSVINVIGNYESSAYVDITVASLAAFGVNVERRGNRYFIPAGTTLKSPGEVKIDTDWSNSAFFLCAGALGSDVCVRGLDFSSHQGDKAVMTLLEKLGGIAVKTENYAKIVCGGIHGCEIDISETPDLLPTLAAVAAVGSSPTRFVNAARLRLKESDRIETVAAMVEALGGKTSQTADSLTVLGGGLTGGTVDCANDHRIAMAAAIAATACKGEVVLIGCECVNKSYPGFFDDFTKLGGKVNVF